MGKKKTRHFVHRNFYVDEALTPCPMKKTGEGRAKNIKDLDLLPSQCSLGVH